MNAIPYSKEIYLLNMIQKCKPERV